jgi:hypothetical protein
VTDPAAPAPDRRRDGLREAHDRIKAMTWENRWTDGDDEYVLERVVHVILDEYAALAEAAPPSGQCWFCKGTFVVDALIAGYDTFDEQRLACLACNERMQGNWRSGAAPPSGALSMRMNREHLAAAIDKAEAASKTGVVIDVRIARWLAARLTPEPTDD